MAASIDRNAVGAVDLFRIDPPQSGQENMRIDRAWLEEVESASGPLTLCRLYRWQRPTVSTGRNQPVEAAANLSFCHQQEIEIVGRPTGGRAVLHGQDLTYAIASNELDRFGQTISESYRRIGLGLEEGLRRYGIETSWGRPPLGRPQKGEPCFLRAGRQELLAGGRKLVGSAQRRLRRSFLQHGSIPLIIDYEMMARALNSSADLLRNALTCVTEQHQGRVHFRELAECLREGFEASWQEHPR